MGIRIITDSASDITPQEAAQLGITVLPLTVSFGMQSFLDGVELTHSRFFQMLIESDELPVTSQVPPALYEQAFCASDDDIICITISSKLSGCLQSAAIAARERSNIHLIDSENVCVGERILVLLAARLRLEGLPASEISARLENEKKKIRILGIVNTLEYLMRGGRISKAAALAGSLINIKPVITLTDGAITVAGRARGSKNSSNLLKTLTEKEPIDFTKPFCLASAGPDDSLLKKYIEDSRSLYPCSPDNLPVSQIGCVIGTHTGPGAVAVAFFTK